MDSIFSILTTIYSTDDNEERRKAEIQLDKAKESDPLRFLQTLLDIVPNMDASLEVRHAAIVIFRQHIEPNKEYFAKIPRENWESFEKALMALLTKESQREVYIGISHAIGVFASRVVPEGSWNNLLSTMVQLAQRPNTFHREGFLIILDCLAEYTIKNIEPHFENIKALLASALKDENQQVRTAAVKCYGSIVVSINEEDKLKPFVGLITDVLKTLDVKDEEAIQQNLQYILYMVSNQPYIIQTVQNFLIKILVAMCRAPQLEFTTHRLALETLIVLSKTGGGIRNNNDYVRQCIQLLFMFCSRYDEELDFNMPTNDLEQEYILCGKDCVRDFSTWVGGHMFSKHALPILRTWLDSNNKKWKEVYGAIIIFSESLSQLKVAPGFNLKEGKSKSAQHFSTILPIICKLIMTYEVAQVQHAGLLCIQNCLDVYKGEITKKWSDLLLRMFTEKLEQYMINFTEKKDNNNSNIKIIHDRVAVQLLTSIIQYSNNGIKEELIKYSDRILKCCYTIVSCNTAPIGVLEQTVTVIGSAAYCIDSDFDQYYARFMKILMEILMKAKEDKLQNLRGKTMECIGLMGQAVGTERFKQDAHYLMKVLLPLRRSLQESNDNTAYNYLNQLFARICRAIDEEFVQYFPQVIPHLLKSAAIDAGHVMRPDEPSPTDKNFHVVTLHIRGLGDSTLSVNPICLEEKTTACHILYQLAHDQPLGFFPYAWDTAQILCPLMKYPLHDQVRAAATRILPIILKSIFLGLQAERTSPVYNLSTEKLQQFRDTLDVIWEPFKRAIIMERDLCELVPLLEVLAKMLAVIHHSEKMWSLKEDQLKDIADIVNDVLEESLQRSKKRQTLLHDEDNKDVSTEKDDKLALDIEIESEIEEQLIAYCIDVVEYTYKVVHEKFSPLFIECLFPLVKDMIESKGSTASQRVQGMCFIADAIEHGGVDQYASYLYKYASLGINDEDLDINQNSIYALGMLATKGLLPDAQSTWLPRLKKMADAWMERKKLKEKMQETQKKSHNRDDVDDDDDDEFDGDDTEMKQKVVFENVVGAIGKIIRYNKPPSNIVEMLRWWVHLLPIVEDVEEMTNIVENLLFFVDKFGPELFKNKETAEHILFVLHFYVSAYHGAPSVYETIMVCTCEDDDDDRPELAMLPVVDLETMRKTFKLLTKLKEVLPSEMFEKVNNKLGEDEKKNMQFYYETYCK